MSMTLDGTNGVFLPTWTTATRPASPANGELGYNSTTGQLDQYVSGAWSSVPTGSGSSATPTSLGTVYGSTLNTSVITALGYQSAASSTSNGTTSIGFQALYNQTSSSTVNTAVGYQAGYSLTTGSGSNVFVGATAGYYATGTNNTALGYACLANNNSGATGSYNTSVGSLSLASNTTAVYNTAIGYQSLNQNTTAQGSTAVGYQTLNANTTGAFNTAVGMQALEANTTGGLNVCLGYQAGGSLTTGSNNLCLGIDAGTYSTTLTTGSFNTVIGYGADASSTSASYQIVLCSNPSTGKGDSTGFINPHGGGVYQGNNSSSWSTTSDQRLKKNIVDNNVGLDKVVQIQVRNFEYRTEDEITDLPKHSAITKQGVQLGVIAQELQQILPDCVKQESTGVLSVDTSDITWHLINAIKELNAKVIQLESKLGV